MADGPILVRIRGKDAHMTVIGLISDTHGNLSDDALAAMADVDHIIHAGRHRQP